jgi:hypothetical protein
VAAAPQGTKRTTAGEKQGIGMLSRILFAFVLLFLLAIPAVQHAIELGINLRFSYLLLF